MKLFETAVAQYLVLFLYNVEKMVREILLRPPSSALKAEMTAII